MSGRTRRVLGAALVLALACLVPWAGVSAGAEANASETAPSSALQRRLSRVPAQRPVPARAEGGGSWWLGTASVAVALAAVGWVSVASRRYVPRAGAGNATPRVVGRTSLSPRHTIYLLDVGDRVLILGTGPQGAPSLLGELTDPAERARVVESADGGDPT